MLKTFVLAALPLMLVAPHAHAQSMSSPQRSIQRILDQQMAAANAHDTDRFLADYLHDSTLVLVFNGAITTGFDSVRALQLKWWNNGKSDVIYTRRGAPIFTVLTPEVVVVTQPLASSRTGPDGKTITGAFTATSIWQKRPRGWRVVAAHESTMR
jgi:ketosteroid isomerase-like protein